MLPDWLKNLFVSSNQEIQQGTTMLCGNLDPDGETQCDKPDEHIGSCAYTGYENIIQWQTEDSLNYQ